MILYNHTEKVECWWSKQKLTSDKVTFDPHNNVFRKVSELIVAYIGMLIYRMYLNMRYTWLLRH